MGFKQGAKCEKIARTGRVQDWLDSPDNRLPASCTTFVVEDDMEGPDGIEASWRYVSHGLRNAAGVAVHLSKLRPRGSNNGKGLIASGPVSFAAIYSKLNEILRRGGKFRNGAITLHLDYDHPDALDFVNASRAELPWAKRCLNVDQHFLDKASPELVSACLKSISNGDLWLTKMRTDSNGARIYGNVCVAGDTLVNTSEGPVAIRDLVGTPFKTIIDGGEYASSERGAWSNGIHATYTLVLSNGLRLRATGNHKILTPAGWKELGNLAMGDEVVLAGDLDRSAQVASVKHHGEEEVFDCSIPSRGAFNANGIYVSNCLEVLLPHRGTCLLEHVNMGACSIDNLSEAFVEGMKELCDLHGRTGVGDTGEYLSPEIDRQVGLGVLGLANFLSIHGISYKDFGDALEAYTLGTEAWDFWYETKAGDAVSALNAAISAAAEIAREHKMERAFAIAPTASCSYRYLDARGFTTAPEIAPPIARLVDRDSETMGVERFEYGPVEIAEEVGWEAFRKVADGVARLYFSTGLYHAYSLNWWSDLVVCDEAFLREWLQSPQTSLYYALQVQSGTQAKDDVGVELGESLTSFFGLEDTDEVESCSVDAGFCAACAE